MGWDILNAIEDFSKCLDLNPQLRYKAIWEWIWCFEALNKEEMAERDRAYLEILSDDYQEFLTPKILEN